MNHWLNVLDTEKNGKPKIVSIYSNQGNFSNLKKRYLKRLPLFELFLPIESQWNRILKSMTHQMYSNR